MIVWNYLLHEHDDFGTNHSSPVAADGEHFHNFILLGMF